MKTNTVKYPYYWLTLTMCIGLTANAQKLPNVQPAGLYAPANVKIDGNTTEWNNQLQAHNKSTAVFYTMANNTDNLYLAVQATDKTIIDKILGGGITLTISSNDKKSIPVSISTPLLPATNKATVTKKTNSKDPLVETDLPEINKAISGGLKEMAVKGITAIPDSAISIYNEYGIKVAGQLDISKAYTCELAIPLKYINQLTGTTGTFNYKVMLNGSKSSMADLIAQIPASSIQTISVSGNGVMVNGSSMNEITSPTDFSGTYTLVKK